MNRWIREPRFAWDSLHIWLIQHGYGPNASELAVVVGMDYQAFTRAKNKGSVSLGVADEIAYRLGIYPSEIWAEYLNADVQGIAS